MKKRPHQLSLVIADDHPAFLQGLATILRSHSEMKVVAQCGDGATALSAIRKLTPDIAVINIALPGLHGLDVLKTIVSEGHPTRVIFLTADNSNARIKDAILGGAKGIISKSALPGSIVRSVRKVAAGKYQIPKELAAALRRRKIRRPKYTAASGGRLTPREAEVARFVARGLSNKEIGRQINLSEGTVKIHLHNIFKKMRISNRTALATFIVSRDATD